MRVASLALLVSTALCLLAPSKVVAQSPEALAEAGHWKRVRAIVEPRVKANPNDAQALWLLARVKEAYGDRDGALPLAEKAVALDGRNPNYHVELASLCGSLAQTASIFSQLSLARRVKSELETALGVDPKHVDAMWGLMQFLWQAPGLVGGDKDRRASWHSASGRSIRRAATLRRRSLRVSRSRQPASSTCIAGRSNPTRATTRPWSPW